jgi:hypothetical protein
MKITQLPTAVVATSWLATLILTVAWVACPSGRPLTAQQPAAPTGAAASAPTRAIPPTSASTAPNLASQVDPNLLVLTRGAVHEAFGQPVLFNPAPNPVIPNKPPTPVEEIPPSMKPAGNDVEWIPGYWSWEVTQQKFIWTSGIWRVIPPGLAWAPGYWTQSGPGYQWVSGYWHPSATTTALASFSKQMGATGLASPLSASPTAPITPNGAGAPNAASNPTLPTGTTPVANPTNAPGLAPTAASPAANATGAPVAAAGAPVTAAGIPVAAAGPPVAAAGEASILGAVPGPNLTTPDPTAIAAFPAAASPAANPMALGTNPPSPVDPTAAILAGVPPVAAGAAPLAPPGTGPTAARGDASVASAAPINATGTSASGDPFVPQPPASLESGPIGNPPTPDYSWIPGTWIHRHGRVLWLGGQWSPIHRGWVWIPAHYVATPAGYVFVDGYWDYELAQRGVLFAPVSFHRGYHAWGFTYTPSVALNTDLLTNCLFVNSPCGCYCFGDYYEANCAQAGIFPWFAFHMSSLGYDPCFAFCSWAHHKDAGWHEKVVSDFRAIRSDARMRPPRTFDDLATSAHHSGAEFELLAMPLGKFVASTGASSMRFENLSAAEHGEFYRSRHRYYEAASRRLELETKSSRNNPADAYLHHPRGGVADRREGKSAEGNGKSKIAEDRSKSKFANDRRSSTSISEEKQVVEAKSGESRQTSSRNLATTRTPPVVPRRPVSTDGLGQHGIQESPDQRVANPKFVPQASNRGRSEPAQKASVRRYR